MRFSFFCNRKKIQILPNDAGHWSGRLEMVWKTPRTGSLATGFTPSLVTAQQTQKNAQKNSFTGFTILYIVDSPHSKSLKSALESSFSNLRGSKWPNSTKLYIIYHLKIKNKLYEKVRKFWKKWPNAPKSIGSLRSDFHWSGRLEMGWRTPRTGSLATRFTPSLVTAQQTKNSRP